MISRSQRKELELLRKALKDWLKPLSECTDNETHWGFCNYFGKVHCVNQNNYKLNLPTLFKYRTVEDSVYWFNGRGLTEVGRRERIAALQKAIEEIENN